MARLTLARKIATIVLIVFQRAEFSPIRRASRV
jgi:hypothetical protein